MRFRNTFDIKMCIFSDENTVGSSNRNLGIHLYPSYDPEGKYSDELYKSDKDTGTEEGSFQNSNC